ncbi:efflux RND transporter permease subunit [Sporichthya sp.]|uniref:MMPL family transporter n=1 Tax=Sporichthya sp. TaxID=65475 RepID=UPI0017DC6081|nr:MMPL family transporter [Sporichthya sp.]MBA3742097.1 MMPL family transporter [Sporichthya sp.]
MPTYAALRLVGDTDEDKEKAYAAVRERLAAPGLHTELGGPVAVFADIGNQVESDIAKAEALSLPIVFLLLVFVFGSLAAAAMPLVIGGLAILGAFTMLHVLTLFTDVSIFAINIVTMLGLGLAIDYALFVVSRFREELPRTANVEEALARTMATAGRTVAFSGLTVAISLASLLLFPQPFLQSMGFGGMAAVLVAMLGALTVLPALLAVMGHRIDALKVPRPRLFRGGGGSGEGAWARVARGVMKRPAAVAGAVIAVLLVLGTSFLHADLGGIDSRVLPTGTESRVADETLAAQFAGDPSASIDVVVSGADQAGTEAYLDRLRDLPGVTGAEVAGSSERGEGISRIALTFDALPTSHEAQNVVGEIRDLTAPPGAEVLVGGQSAELVDLLAGLRATLPWMALFVAVVTLLLLFAAFGSVVLPLKALVMNMLSLAAAFGAVVWIFQDGHLSGLLGFTPTGTIEATQPILMLAIAFGLSMDYEVFLLSRIREEWDRTGDNTAAVTTGLARTGGIITSAALLLIVVIGAFATSGITFIKMLGVGMVIAIVVDATVVRGLLVPATMRLLGAANWWAPTPLRRAWERYGFREGEAVAAPVPLPAGVPVLGPVLGRNLVPVTLPAINPVYPGGDLDRIHDPSVLIRATVH